MSDATFILHLAPGVSVDSNGAFAVQTSKGPTSYPTFDIPLGSLPVKPELVAEQFKNIGNILPIPAIPEVGTILEELQVPAVVVKLFGQVAQIASMLAAATGV